MSVGRVSQPERRGSRKASMERAGLTCSRNEKARVKREGGCSRWVLRDLGRWPLGDFEVKNEVT